MKLKDKSKKEFEDIINTYLKTYLEKLQQGDSEDKINAFEENPLDSENKLLVDIGHYVELDETKYSLNELSEAENFILDGKYVPHFLGAGAATRFGKGPLFLLTPSQISPESGKKFLDITLGERLFLAYRTYLNKLSEKHNRNILEVLQNQKIVMHVNEQIKLDIEKLIFSRKWFGFSPENFIILVQETYPAFKIENNTLVQTTEKYPYGHGHTLLQLGFKDEGYYITEDQTIRNISESVLDYLENKGAEVLVVHRVNDLYRYSLNPVCSYKLYHSLEEFKKGTKLGIELVANPENQKGGKWLTWKENSENSFLLETLNAKENYWDKAFSELEEKHLEEKGEGIPYNAFRNIYNIKSLNEILHLGLKPSLRVRNDLLTLEFVTGDITFHPEAKTTAFHLKGERISDFKSPDQVTDFFKVISEQEKDIHFDELAKEYITKLE